MIVAKRPLWQIASMLKAHPFAALLFLCAASFAQSAQAQESAPAVAEEAVEPSAPIVAAEFYSSWCGPCHLLRPKVKAALEAHSEAKIDFIEFDFTWGKKDRHTQMAADYGIADVFERYKKGQGFVLFVDPETGRVVDIVTGFSSKDEVNAAFARAAALRDGV